MPCEEGATTGGTIAKGILLQLEARGGYGENDLVN